MELARALRVLDLTRRNIRLAITGAGGKTTALFQLARQFAQEWQIPVLTTTTTHLAKSQLSLADHIYVVRNIDDIKNLEVQLTPGVILVVGEDDSVDRVSGLDPTTLKELCHLADNHLLPLLIEADGSRNKPLKAPADHEPVIPPFVDTVLVVAGLSGLGKPLSSTWVHRPERYAELSGLGLGQLIRQEDMERVILAADGGLKGIPAGARRVLLLNQADTLELSLQGQGMTQELLTAYEAVLVGALTQPTQVTTICESVAGVVLAAGEGKRYGQPKQLLPWRGRPFVWHSAQTALDSGLSPVVVVTGAYAAEVENALHDLPVSIAYNPNWEQGQSTSLQTAIRCLSPRVKACVFLLADQPQIPVELVRGLVNNHAATLSPLVAPRVNGRRGNPVLFDILTFSDLLSLSGNTGGRHLFCNPAKFPVSWVDWPDEHILLDVDTADDYNCLLAIE